MTIEELQEERKRVCWTREVLVKIIQRELSDHSVAAGERRRIMFAQKDTLDKHVRAWDRKIKRAMDREMQVVDAKIARYDWLK